jgi:hypothetical protein
MPPEGAQCYQPLQGERSESLSMEAPVAYTVVTEGTQCYQPLQGERSESLSREAPVADATGGGAEPH